MKKLLLGLLVLVGAASSGCIIAEDGPGYHEHHHHCHGCGHVYVGGGWR